MSPFANQKAHYCLPAHGWIRLSLEFFIFPLICTLFIFCLCSMHSQFKERQWEYSSQRRECGRLGCVSIAEFVYLSRNYTNESTVCSCECLPSCSLKANLSWDVNFFSRWHGRWIRDVCWKGKMMPLFIAPLTVAEGRKGSMSAGRHLWCRLYRNLQQYRSDIVLINSFA